MALFVLFLGGGKFPFLSPFYPYFFPFFLFFFAKNAFFFASFFLVKITPQKNVRLKIAFLDRVSQSTNVSLSSSVHASSANPSRTTFLRRRETTTKKKRPPRARSGRFCGVGFGRRRASLSFLKVFFVRFFPRERERERERERDLEKDLSDRAKNDAAR